MTFSFLFFFPMQVRYLQIAKKSKTYQPYRWVRYVTQANSYVARLWWMDGFFFPSLSYISTWLDVSVRWWCFLIVSKTWYDQSFFLLHVSPLFVSETGSPFWTLKKNNVWTFLDWTIMRAFPWPCHLYYSLLVNPSPILLKMLRESLCYVDHQLCLRL